MEVSVRTSDNVIVQYGSSLGELAGCIIQIINDDEAPKLHEPGEKTLNEDGTVAVASTPTPPNP